MKKTLFISIGLLMMMISVNSVIFAKKSDLRQEIAAGTLSVDVVDASYTSIDNPVVEMDTQIFDFNCQTATGDLGTSGQQVYIVSPDAADDGWDVTISADSVVSTWEASGVNTGYDYNDPNGCTDGGDTDLLGGQLTVDPSAGVLDNVRGSLQNITVGSTASFNEGVVDSVTLVTASASSGDRGAWTFTGSTVSQQIPAEQPVDDYTLSLTMTVTAK